MKGEKSRSRFLLCVRNDGSDDLEPRKVYQVLPDQGGAHEGFVRVIDESGEGLSLSGKYFVLVRLPLVIARALLSPSNEALQPTVQKVRRR